MKAFLFELIAAMREGPRLYFAPVAGAIRAARLAAGSHRLRQ